MSGRYRIVEKDYEDGHKTYTAQEAVTIFGIPIYWVKYVLKEENYYGDTVKFFCCGETYEGCLQQLKKNLEEKERERRMYTVVNTIFHKVMV